MRRHHFTALAVVAAVAALVTSSADAKFKVSLAFEPAQPIARQLVRITMRTETVLPTRQRMSLVGVGPWRNHSGQGVLDVPLVRIGPRAFRARLRFPYAGRWRIQVVSATGSGPLPPIIQEMRVRPPA